MGKFHFLNSSAMAQIFFAKRLFHHMIGKVLFLSNFTQVPLKWQHTPHCLQNQVIPIEYINLESWVSMNIFPEKSIKLLQTDKSKACVSNIRKAASLSKFPKVSEHERKLQTSFKIAANAGFLFGEAFFAPIQQILVPCTIFTTSSGGEGAFACICGQVPGPGCRKEIFYSGLYPYNQILNFCGNKNELLWVATCMYHYYHRL